MICNAKEQDYIRLLGLWEDAVRATHTFLSEQEIESIKASLLSEYFEGVTIYICKNNLDHIVGFCGVVNQKIEMLFIAPTSQAQGFGSALCRYAIQFGA